MIYFNPGININNPKISPILSIIKKTIKLIINNKKFFLIFFVIKLCLSLFFLNIKKLTIELINRIENIKKDKNEINNKKANTKPK